MQLCTTFCCGFVKYLSVTPELWSEKVIQWLHFTSDHTSNSIVITALLRVCIRLRSARSYSKFYFSFTTSAQWNNTIVSTSTSGSQHPSAVDHHTTGIDRSLSSSSIKSHHACRTKTNDIFIANFTNNGLTTCSWRTSTLESVLQIEALAAVVARRAETLVQLHIAVLTTESRVAPAHDVITGVHARPVIAIDSGAFVKSEFTPTSVEAYRDIGAKRSHIRDDKLGYSISFTERYKLSQQ